MSLITVLGRGHSGTRMISQTLYSSGVFMGQNLNPSADLIPPWHMYDACRVFARYVEWKGALNWDFSKALESEIPPRFVQLVEQYLRTVLENKSEHRGWKLPEATLVYPWVERMFPETKFIFWVRNPRDGILSEHKTDDLRDFGIRYPDTEDERRRRAISWKYQHDLIHAVPKPAHWIQVRYEDFVMNQERELERLEDFLSMKLARIVVRPDRVKLFKNDDEPNFFDFLGPAMASYGYEVPSSN